jgi:hypothetical protein
VAYTPVWIPTPDKPQDRIAVKDIDGEKFQRVLTTFDDSMNLDAFSRVRVSQPTSLFDVQCQYDAEPLLLETGGTGTGSAGVHSADTRMVALSCTAGAGTSFIQSYEYLRYQAGRSQQVFATGVFGAGAAGATVDLGVFDADNGFFLRQNDTNGFQVVLRSKVSGSVVERVVDQAEWNLDPMDGTGPSGWVLDPAMNVIFGGDAQFLAMGRCRLALDIDGVIFPIHQFLNAQRIATPYMQTLTLPVQMLVTTTSAAKTAHFKCANVSSEGGVDNPFAYSFATPEQTVTAGNGARTHILSIRPKTTFNGLVNRTRINVDSVDITVTGSNQVRWELCIGSTFTAAPTWADVNTAYSAVEASATVGTLNAAGTVIASGYVAATASAKSAISSRLTSRIPLTLNRAGAQRALGTLSLIVTGLGGTSASRASFNFSEVR